MQRTGTLALLEVLDRDGMVRQAWRIERWPVTIGRALDNDVVLTDPHVAPHHATIDLVDGGDGAPATLVVTAGDDAQRRRRRPRAHRRRRRAELADAAATSTCTSAAPQLRLRLPGHALGAGAAAGADAVARDHAGCRRSGSRSLSLAFVLAQHLDRHRSRRPRRARSARSC